MPWTVIAVVLAVVLLVILIYPFRIRVQYDKRDPQGSPLHAAIKVYGWWRLPLSIKGPLATQPSPGQTQEDPKGSTTSAGSPTNTASSSDEVKGGSQAQGEASLLRMAAGFIRVLVFEAGAGRKKPKAKRPPSLRTGVAPHILRSIHTFDKWEWETSVGTGDAASTAIAVGTFWSLKGTLYTFLAAHVRFTRPPKFKVQPHWDDPHFDMRIDCIFRLRIGEIILAWLRDTVKAWNKGVQRFGFRKGTSH